MAPATETVGLSDSALNPPKTLLMTSEGATLSGRNFPAPLLTEAAIAEARLSDVVLNPVKTLSAASETLGVSESVLNPVMTLPTTSDGTTLRSGNFAAPFLTEAAIAKATDIDLAPHLFNSPD